MQKCQFLPKFKLGTPQQHPKSANFCRKLLLYLIVEGAYFKRSPKAQCANLCKKRKSMLKIANFCQIVVKQKNAQGGRSCIAVFFLIFFPTP